MQTPNRAWARNAADARNVLDDDQPEEEPQPSKNRGKDKGRDSKTTRHQDVVQDLRNVKPPEISDRVWFLAEQWLEMGRAKFDGEYLRINKRDFSRRLDEKINSDPDLRRWLDVEPATWEKMFGGKWASGAEFVNDVLVRMSEMFFENLLIESQKNSSLLQFDFLRDEWDEWLYHATISVRVAWNKDHATWLEPELPRAVFDPRTVGAKDPDRPCEDPMFEGMTWAQVRARSGEDEGFLEPATDPGEPLTPARPPTPADRIATELRAKVAKRKNTTTKETTTDDHRA